MARTSNPAATASTAAHHESANPPTRAEASSGSIDAARSMVTNVLSAACSVTAWLTQMQEWHVRSAAAMAHALQTALHDSERARDPQALMAVTTKMFNQQMALAMRQFGSGMAQSVDSDLQLVERMGVEIASMAQQALPGAFRPGHEQGANGSGLREIGRLQDQWLAMTQRWIDAAAAQVQH